MGNGAIKADWGQPGEDAERERKRHPSSALQLSSSSAPPPKRNSDFIYWIGSNSIKLQSIT